MKILCVFFFSVFVSSISAQENDKSVSLLFNYHPSDFFVGGTFQVIKKSNQFSFGAQLGVNRTFFQKRIYPKINFQYSKICQFNSFFGGQVSSRIAISSLNVSTNKQAVIQVSVEPTIGLGLFVGKKFKTSVSVFYGPSFSFKKTISSQNNWTTQLILSPEIQFTYDF